MAQTLENIRSLIQTSIFGRRLGLDSRDFLVGCKPLKLTTIELTSASTGTELQNHGVVSITGTSLLTSANAFQIGLPEPGVAVTYVNVNARTSAASPGSTAMTFVRTSSNMTIVSSEGSTMTTINLTPGSAVTLMGLTTAATQVVGRTTLAGVIINGTT